MKVGVHIADVTHFIKPGTNIDAEALKRGTSVYLSDKVAAALFSTYQYFSQSCVLCIVDAFFVLLGYTTSHRIESSTFQMPLVKATILSKCVRLFYWLFINFSVF